MTDTRLRLIAKKKQGTLQGGNCIYFESLKTHSEVYVCRFLSPSPANAAQEPPHAEWPQVRPQHDWCSEHTTELDIHADEEWFKTRLEEANKKVKQLS